MACCGGNRTSRPSSHHYVTPAPAQADAHFPSGPTLHYTGTSAILVRGPRTGRTYTFTPESRNQSVAHSDAEILLRTRLFSPISDSK